LKLRLIAPEAGSLELADLGALRRRIATASWVAPSFLLNIVADSNGNFVGSTGSSRDITTEVDYQALVGYREAADGILTSAGTARSEAYRRSRLAPLAIASRSANFDDIPAVEDAAAGPTDSLVYLLVTSRQVRNTRKRYTQPWVRVVSTGLGRPFGVTFRITRLGWRRVVVEAGPEYARWLIRNSVIRYLALSVVGVQPQNAAEAGSASYAALKNLGIREAALYHAEFADQTLLTLWSEFRVV